MARSERQVPTVYFGRPGSLLPLPWPRGDMDRTYERQTFDFLTGAGSHAVSSLANGSRSYLLNFNALHEDTFTNLEQYRIGANGPAPFVLIDPSAPNLLHPNVAAATGILNNATGILTFQSAIPNDNGIPSSNSDATFIHRAQGWRSIRWRFSVTPTAFPTLGVAPMYRSWPAYPVVPNMPYTWSSWMRPDNIIDSNMTCAMKMEWQDSAGVGIGAQPSSGDIPLTAWTRLSVTATSPSNAVYVRPMWVATSSTITLNSSFYIDEPMLEQDSVLNNWAPSSGLRPVEIVGLTEGVPFAARFRTGIQLSLRELAR